MTTCTSKQHGEQDEGTGMTLYNGTAPHTRKEPARPPETAVIMPVTTTLPAPGALCSHRCHVVNDVQANVTTLPRASFQQVSTQQLVGLASDARNAANHFAHGDKLILPNVPMSEQVQVDGCPVYQALVVTHLELVF